MPKPKSLHTNELLQKRIKEFDIPSYDAAQTFDNVAIYRINGGETKMTAGGLHIPQTAQDVENRGVLISAGLKAMDELAGEGIDLGMIVEFGRYAGDERLVERKVGTAGRTVVLCKSKDINGCKDTKAKLDSGEAVIDVDAESGEHFYEEIS